MIVVQWGATERAPQKYEFTAYRQVCEMLRRYDLKLQVRFPKYLLALLDRLGAALATLAFVLAARRMGVFEDVQSEAVLAQHCRL